MEPFATVDDVINLFRELSLEEQDRAKALLPVVSDNLRLAGRKAGKDVDELAEDDVYRNVLKSVTVDIVSRALLTDTKHEPVSNFSEAAFGYSVSGTFLSPGGGLFIKRDELKKLGLLPHQKYGVIDFYGLQDTRDPRDDY